MSTRTLAHSKKNSQHDTAARSKTRDQVDAALLKLNLAEHEIAKLALERNIDRRAQALREAMARLDGARRALLAVTKELGHDA